MMHAARRGSSDRGMSAMEVILAVVIVAVLLLPLLGASQEQERSAFFLEYHLTAQWRARALLAYLGTQDLVALERRLNGGQPFPPGPDGVPELAVPVPGPDLARMGRLHYAPPGASGATLSAIASARAGHFRDALFLGIETAGEPGSAHLYRLRALISFTFPGDVARREHAYELVRLIARPGLSHRVLPYLQ